MTQLNLKLYQPKAQGFLEYGAVATVRLLADASGKVVKDWWLSEKPVGIAGGSGQSGRYTEFDLPRGGTYGVDITRPRGADISVEYLIEEGDVRTETIVMEGSPHEYLGWQQFAGIVRADPYKREGIQVKGVSFSTDVRRDALMLEGQSQIDALYEKVKSVPEVFKAELPATVNAWEVVDHSTPLGGDWALGGGRLHWDPRYDPEFVTWFKEMPDPNEGLALVDRLHGQFPPEDSLDRKFPRWVSFKTDGQIDLASVPWAWWGYERDPDEEIRFVYDRVRPSPVAREAPGHLTISVQDRRWFGLLEFLASGRLTQASDMFDTVMAREDPEMALYGKQKGPLVAVAGGIILISSAQSSDRQRWDRWLENLSNWFPGIPDGAILLGCRRVAQAQNLGKLETAFSHLKEGVERGIPFFTSTIRMLSVALAQISNDIPEAGELRQSIAPVAARVNPNQPFTVIRL